MSKILVVDDDATTALTVKEWLALEHHTVDVAFTGNQALDYLNAFGYDLLILDRNLPGPSGVDICRQHKLKSRSPVLMLTGMSSIEQKVEGLEAGADDYLTKPFDMRELNARVKALLRRSNETSEMRKMTIRDVTIDISSRVVKRGEREITLSPREYEVLEFFFRNTNQVVSPDALLKRVWHSDDSASPHAVYSCLNRLRKNLNPEDKEYLIKTVHGVGYRLDT
jgi:two-component system, OmpR family, response regulator